MKIACLQSLFLYSLFFLSVPACFAQSSHHVKGTITDAQTGATVPGVNILVKGTTTGTSTDADGKYSLTVPSLQDTLVFSFVGYK